MRTACFAEAILEHVVGSLEEKHGDLQARSAQRLEFFFKVSEKLTFTNVDHESGAPDSLLFVVVDESPKGRQHRYRQIIDAEVSEILECISGGRHSRPAEAGDDYDIWNIHDVYLATKGTKSTKIFMCFCAFVAKALWFDQPVVAVVSFVDNSESRGVGVAKN